MTTIHISKIIRSAGTQFRNEMSEDNVIDLMDLIERDVPFKTPMRLARCNDTLYLVDGFHRFEAFSRLKIAEIPADRFSIADVESIEEVRVLAAGANVQHGKGNGAGDYRNIISKLMEFGDTYKKNSFEPDISKIALAIGAARPAVLRGYNNYPSDKSEPTLSNIIEEERNAAILNQHKKGLSNRAIAKLFNMQDTTVGNVLSEVRKKSESEELRTPASPSVFPQANTEDRSETRADADELFDSLLEDYSDYITLAESEVIPKPKFDLKAMTGFGDDIAKYTKREKAEEVTPPWPEEAAMAQVIEAMKTLAKDELIEACRIALAPHGITLSI